MLMLRVTRVRQTNVATAQTNKRTSSVKIQGAAILIHFTYLFSTFCDDFEGQDAIHRFCIVKRMDQNFRRDIRIAFLTTFRRTEDFYPPFGGKHLNWDGLY